MHPSPPTLPGGKLPMVRQLVHRCISPPSLGGGNRKITKFCTPEGGALLSEIQNPGCNSRLPTPSWGGALPPEKSLLRGAFLRRKFLPPRVGSFRPPFWEQNVNFLAPAALFDHFAPHLGGGNRFLGEKTSILTENAKI